MENNSATYCKFYNKECDNGANWSSHVASAKHLKKAGAAKPATIEVVSMGGSYDDDEWEDFEGDFAGPKAPVTSTPIASTPLASPSIWDQSTTSRGLATPRPFVVDSAPNITTTAAKVVKQQQPITASTKATTIINNKPTTVVATTLPPTSNPNGKTVKQ